MIRRTADRYSVVRDPRYFTLIVSGSSPKDAFGNLQMRGDLRTKSSYKVVAKPMRNNAANAYAQQHAHEFDGGKVVGCVPIYTPTTREKIKDFDFTVNARTETEARELVEAKLGKELKKERELGDVELYPYFKEVEMISPAAKLITMPPTVGTKYLIQGCGDHRRFSTKEEAIAYYMENPTPNLSWNPCILVKEEDVAVLDLVPDDTLPTFTLKGEFFILHVEHNDYLFFGLR